MVNIFVILGPKVDFTLGQGVHAFLGHIKGYFIESYGPNTAVSTTVDRAIYTENAAEVQIEIGGECSDCLVDKIKESANNFPGFAFSIPKLTIKVSRRK